MRFRGAWYSRYARPWEDRVAGADEAFDDDVDVEKLVQDALEAARTAVECTVVPLAAMIERLPAAIDIEWRHHRRARRHRHGHNAAWDW